ncbi:hypothetical protein ACFL2X_04650 [Candidatus Latescibacterota bacterium]
MKVAKILLILILCHNGFVSGAETLVPAEIYGAISGYILSGRYDMAKDVADRLITAHPDEPVGPLLKASVLQYECIDYEDYSGGEEFEELLDKAEKNARIRISMDGSDLWARYFLYAVNGLRGARASISGQLVYGVVKVRSSALGMEKIISDDSEFYDAYLMFGSYRFWKSFALGRAALLPFIDDESNIGISGVKKAIDNGVLTGPLSNTVLIEILLANNPELAVELAEKMFGQYPSCRLFAWQLGEGYKKLGCFEDAERIFTGIAESMREDEFDDGSGVVRSWWKLAVLAKSVGKKEECIYYCNKIIDLGEKRGEKNSVYERQRERIEKALRMKEAFENE